MTKDNADRRQFFVEVKKNLVGLAAFSLEQLIPEQKPKRIRPPGALPELEFIAKCDRCGLCLDECPNKAIKLSGVEWGLEAGTPYLVPGENPCSLCGACAQNCPAGAILPVEKPRIGMAEIDEERCLAWQNNLCGNCVYHCPSQGIRLVNRKPEILRQNCTGCGKCAGNCFAEGSAIKIIPLEQRD